MSRAAIEVNPGHRRPVAGRRLAAIAFGLALLAPAVPAQVDFIVSKIEVNQVIQTGSTPLVGGARTFVRATVRIINPTAPTTLVDGLLRVYVDGVEAPGSPIFSDNGPYPAQNGANPANENGTLNFVLLAPTSNNVVFAVEVNPAGPNFVPEANTANNINTTPAYAFGYQKVPDFAYVPIDYRPSGGSIPNLPDPELTRPGIGDNFLQGIYPTKDWVYRRTDAPSKLWTSSLSGSGSALNNSLVVDIGLMVPKPAFLYGWVPGPLPGYNGQSIIGGQVAMGNTELVRFQRTLAHEVGHDFGLSHNTITTNLIGVDTERHLNLTQGLPRIKPASLKDIMYAGLLTQEAWVATGSYTFFYNHFVFDGPGAVAATADDGPKLLVTGLWNTQTGAIDLTDVLTMPSGTATQPAEPGAADLVIRAWGDGRLLVDLPIEVRDSADDGPCTDDGSSGSDSWQPQPVLGFSAYLPSTGAASIDRLVVAQAGARVAQARELRRSAGAPQVAFTSTGTALGGSMVRVAWEAADADGDALTYYLRYSPDGERFVPVATSTQQPFADLDLAQLPRLRPGHGFFELFASDGLRTTVVRSEPLAGGGSYAGVVGNAPWVWIYHPDTGFSFPYGATVILHSSGYDLEDRVLDGASIVWTSDLDGVIGTGRLTSTAGLSVGTHVITVTATDSDGMTASDSATITVTDRGLPTTGGGDCQTDLGFGGPGASVLSLCGGDLSTGTTADLELTGAPASTPALLVAGLVQSAVPFKGGTLVPLPSILTVALVTSPAGGISVPGIAGGGGPVTIYVQCLVVDGAQAQGYGLSNALEVNILP